MLVPVPSLFGRKEKGWQLRGFSKEAVNNCRTKLVSAGSGGARKNFGGPPSCRARPPPPLANAALEGALAAQAAAATSTPSARAPGTLCRAESMRNCGAEHQAAQACAALAASRERRARGARAIGSASAHASATAWGGRNRRARAPWLPRAAHPHGQRAGATDAAEASVKGCLRGRNRVVALLLGKLPNNARGRRSAAVSRREAVSAHNRRAAVPRASHSPQRFVPEAPQQFCGQAVPRGIGTRLLRCETRASHGQRVAFDLAGHRCLPTQPAGTARFWFSSLGLRFSS